MTLPVAPNPITMLQIRNEFYAQTTPNPSNYGTSNSNLFNLNFYRGKYYYAGPASYLQFSSGALTMNDFRGKAANCDCDCACACACGDSG